MRKVDDWVLFMDHDILHLNPHYHEVCLGVIKKVGHKAGWITCMTNRIACEDQWSREAPKCDDVMIHMRYAKYLWEKHGPMLIEMNGKKKFAGFSGFFMLTHKKAWEKVGGFIDGFLGVDNDYYKKIIKHGYKAYVMPGIYVYHIYRNKGKWGEL
jgi:GT2 family glycosyltransferase